MTQWEDRLRQALSDGSTAALVRLLDEQATAHAGTAPSAVKVKALKLIRKALQAEPSRTLALGLELAELSSPTAQELAAALLAGCYEQDATTVADALCRLADSPHWEVREWAASAAGEVLADHLAEFLPELHRWTAHPSGNVRRTVALGAMYASRTLGKEHAEALLDLIEPLMTDRDPYVRKNLGPFAIGDGLLPRYPEAVLARWPGWAGHPEHQVRWNAAMAFTAKAAARHADAVRGAIEQLAANDPSAAVRRAAVSALRKLA